MLTEHNKYETIYKKIQIGFCREVAAQENVLCNRIVNDMVVEVNITYGGKYLDLIEIKGPRGC